jgi:hypothetical protein
LLDPRLLSTGPLDTGSPGPPQLPPRRLPLREPNLLGTLDARALLGLAALRRERGLAAPPHPPVERDLFFLRQRCHAGPGGRLAQVAQLRCDQLRQALAFQHGSRGEPGKDARWEHVKPEKVVVEGKAKNRQKNDIWNRNSSENGDLPDRQRHRQPEVIELV